MKYGKVALLYGLVIGIWIMRIGFGILEYCDMYVLLFVESGFVESGKFAERNLRAKMCNCQSKILTQYPNKNLIFPILSKFH